MPAYPAKPCGYPGCGVLVKDGTNRCEQHKADAFRSNTYQPARIRGRRLMELRAALFKREPLCRLCNGKGIVRLATERDHIVSLGEGGTDTEDNAQPLCKPCHAEKSLAEALRGRMRNR